MNNENIAQEMLITPEAISPYPQLKRKVPNRGRKAGKSCKITASPYKAQLKDSLSSKQHKQQKKSVLEPQPSTSGYQEYKRKKKPMVESATSSEEDTISLSSDSSDDKPSVLQPNDPNVDAECMFCSDLFSENKK